MTTNRQCVVALDFAAVSGSDQLVVGPTHDLLMTEVPHLLLGRCYSTIR